MATLQMKGGASETIEQPAAASQYLVSICCSVCRRLAAIRGGYSPSLQRRARGRLRRLPAGSPILLQSPSRTSIRTVVTEDLRCDIARRLMTWTAATVSCRHPRSPVMWRGCRCARPHGSACRRSPEATVPSRSRPAPREGPVRQCRPQRGDLPVEQRPVAQAAYLLRGPEYATRATARTSPPLTPPG